MCPRTWPLRGLSPFPAWSQLRPVLFTPVVAVGWEVERGFLPANGEAAAEALCASSAPAKTIINIKG